MSDRRISVKHLCNLLCVRHFIVMLIVYLVFDSGMLCNICHTLSVSAVGTDQEFIVCSGNARQDRLNAEYAAPLHEHCRVLLR